MKKVIALFAVLVFCQICVVPVFAMNDGEDEGPTRKGIKLIAIQKPDPEDTKTRSLIPDVEACADYEAGLIEVYFNKDLGNATIQLLDAMGVVLADQRCHSAWEGFATLPLPADDGAYTLKIFTDFADYVGNFVLMR